MYNGLTVEVANTDAEGRLVLADAMAKACEESNPDLLIDFATLTGAARVAVGTEIAAMFSNDDSLAQSLFDSALAVADPIWRLPLFQVMSRLLDSTLLISQIRVPHLLLEPLLLLFSYSILCLSQCLGFTLI